ncbi:hypothetical protein DQ238_08655 [Geodermatophilus sp. TF02-6]|nr:hypothetical protein DQ238_08655 [Geodermatophilus sp. TF02-6]
MGSVQRAVRVPAERPVVAGAPAAGRSGRSARSAPPGAGPRVPGYLRPVGGRAARAVESAPAAPRTRRDLVRPGGRLPRCGGPVPGRVRGGCRSVPAAPLRLTRRGRRVLVVVAAAVAVGLVAAVRSLAAGGPDEDLRLVGGDSVVVQPGDTVWSIAVEVAGGDEDVRAVVDAIEEVNHLDGALVVPGEVLELP